MAKARSLSGAMGELANGLKIDQAKRAPGRALYERNEEPQPPTEETVDGGRLAHLRPDNIEPWSLANRPDSELGDLDELAASIKNEGQQVPILVRPKPGAPDRYEVIYGRRRWLACRELGTAVLCLVRELTDSKAFIAQAVENEKRKNLSAWAKALDYQRALDAKLFPSVQALATECGLDRTSVSNILTFTRIPAPIANAIGSMSMVGVQTAKTILRLSGEHADTIIKHADKIRDGKLGSAKLERLCLASEVTKSRVIKGKGGDLFSISTTGRGALTLTILKNGKSLLTETELAEKLKALFDEAAERTDTV